VVDRTSLTRGTSFSSLRRPGGPRRLRRRAIVEPIGRTLAQRTTLYGRTQTAGRRLRPPDDHVHGDGGDTPIALGRNPVGTPA
jgi:hypothetical protein